MDLGSEIYTHTCNLLEQSFLLSFRHKLAKWGSVGGATDPPHGLWCTCHDNPTNNQHHTDFSDYPRTNIYIISPRVGVFIPKKN